MRLLLRMSSNLASTRVIQRYRFSHTVNQRTRPKCQDETKDAPWARAL